MICGKYVKTFAEADMGMLNGASTNAPYEFHWVYLKAVEKDHIVCMAGRSELRLPYRKTSAGDRAEVTVKDPIFGPIKFPVHPFRRSDEDGFTQPIVTATANGPQDDEAARNEP